MSKETLPNSECVQTYFANHRDDILEIYCGVNALRECNWDSMYPDIKPSLYLPHLHDFTMYWWPVKGLRIVLRWFYEDEKRQQGFANYLNQICHAHCVFTVISNEIRKFGKSPNAWRQVA